MTEHVLVIGGGVIGTMHAWRLIKHGYQVTQIERDSQPVSASVRNFGLVWVGGRLKGEELQEAILARQLWAELAHDNPGLYFRANGSLTVARTNEELAVLEESIKLPDASERGWELLDRAATQKLNPALQGNFKAALHSSLDAAVEPNQVLSSIRQHLLSGSGYTWIPNTEIVDVIEGENGPVAISATGGVFEGDLAIVCPGADHKRLFGDELANEPIRKVRLQMMSTAPLGEQLTTTIADGDSLRYYPAYDVPSLRKLPPQSELAQAAKLQLLMVQRVDGTLTIGDTHEYEEPFDFALREPEYQHLTEVASDILGRRIPEIVRRWDGVYSQRTDGAICERLAVAPTIIVVTGPGGRGNSLSPAIAQRTLQEVGLV
jgi:FAD dependent oxidoreductase TIGR03364